MLTHYCHCGHPNHYSLSLPKFCGGCGTPLGSVGFASTPPAAPRIATKSTPATPTRPTVAKREDDDDDDETPAYPLTVPEKLSVTFQVVKPARQTLGEVLHSNVGNEPRARTARASKKAKRATLNSFREGLQTVRRQSFGGDNANEE